MIKKKRFIAQGLVYGALWGGGEGAYSSITLHGKYLKPLLKNAEKNLQGLDSGMGFEEILGALLTVETITTIIIDKIEYNHSDFHDEIIGDLTDKQIDSLMNINIFE